MPEGSEKPAVDASERKFVAFLDALGFKNVLNDWETATKYYNTLKGVTRAHRGMFETPFDVKTTIPGQEPRIEQIRRPRFSAKLISDSVIISSSDIFSLLMQVSMITGAMLDFDILARGSIAFGRHLEDFSDGDFAVVSEALSFAYVSEQQQAKFPRTILHQTALHQIADLFRFPADATSWNSLSILVQDEDDEWFVDPFFSSGLDLNGVRRFLDEKLTEKFDEGIRSKYFWLSDYLNYRCFAQLVSDDRARYYKTPAMLEGLIEYFLAGQGIEMKRHARAGMPRRFLKIPVMFVGDRHLFERYDVFRRSFAENVAMLMR